MLALTDPRQMPRWRAALMVTALGAATLLSALPIQARPAAQEASPASGNAILSIPPVLRQGDALPVTAEGFSPGVEITLVLMGPGPSAQLLPATSGAAAADPTGRAEWTAQLPRELTLTDSGSWWLNADDAEGHFANVAIQWAEGDAPLPLAGPPAPESLSGPLPIEAIEFPRPPAEPAPATEVMVAAPSLPPSGWAVVRGSDAPAPLVGRVVGVSASVRLRAAPSTSATVLGTLPVGARVRILGGPFDSPDASFYTVQQADGQIAYAALAESDVAVGETGGAGEPYRLRMEPSPLGAIRALVFPGTMVQLLGDSYDSAGVRWMRVRVALPGEGTLDGYLPAEATGAS